MQLHRAFFFSVFLLLVIGSTSCQKEEEISRPFARIRTLPVTEIDSTGVTFNAEVVLFGEQEIIEYGFILYSDPIDRLPNFPEEFNHFSIKQKLIDQQFLIRVNPGIVEGERKIVRAYIRSLEQIIYGDETSFITARTASPVIEKISPDVLVPGDTMIISGKHFFGVNQGGKVFVEGNNNISIDIVAASENEILAIVPRYIPERISIVVKTDIGRLSSPFLLPLVAEPKITDIIPNIGTIGDTITVKGKFFSPILNWNVIGGCSGTVLSASKNEIKFLISDLSPYDSISYVYVWVGDDNNRSSTLPLITSKPVITDFSPKEGHIGDIITISGNNFFPNPASTRVLFKNYNFTVIRSKKNELKVIVNEIPIEIGNTVSDKIRVILAGYDEASKDAFKYIK